MTKYAVSNSHEGSVQSVYHVDIDTDLNSSTEKDRTESMNIDKQKLKHQ